MEIPPRSFQLSKVKNETASLDLCGDSVGGLAVCSFVVWAAREPLVNC